VAHPDRDDARVVVGVPHLGTEQPVHQPFRTPAGREPARRRDQPGEPGPDAVVAALDQAVGVEQQGVPGAQGGAPFLVRVRGHGAQQDVLRRVEQPGPAVADEEQGEVAGAGPDEFAGLRVVQRAHGSGGGAVAGAQGDLVEPAHQLSGRAAGEGEGPLRVAQGDHAGDGVDAVPGDVADGHQDLAGRQWQDVVPVAAHLVLLGGGPVAGGDGEAAGQLAQGGRLGDDGLLELERELVAEFGLVADGGEVVEGRGEGEFGAPGGGDVLVDADEAGDRVLFEQRLGRDP
jgi:hypothetical protein